MKKILAITALLAFSSTSFANEMNAPGDPNTGCGLGTQIIKDKSSVVMQVLAVTTNGTSGNQTFGITSGTLGCEKPARIVSNETSTFVASNMDSLATDIAMGQGENLDTLAALLNIEDKSAFAAKLQQNFVSIYTDDQVSSAQVIDSILTIAG